MKSKIKKLTDEQLYYNLNVCSGNKVEHPSQEGRDFFANKEKLIREEMKRRGLKTQWAAK